MNLIRRLREAPVTVGLIAVNLLVYVVMVALSQHLVSFGNATLVGAGACISGANLEGTHWRWLTAAFVHVGIAHIFMNLWVRAQIGVISERAIGRGLFVATYVATGVVGNVLSTFLGAGSAVPRISAGASGGHHGTHRHGDRLRVALGAARPGAIAGVQHPFDSGRGPLALGGRHRAGGQRGTHRGSDRGRRGWARPRAGTGARATLVGRDPHRRRDRAHRDSLRGGPGDRRLTAIPARGRSGITLTAWPSRR